MQSNRLLAKLSRKNQRELLAACDEVELVIGDVLWEPCSRISHVYFPLGCFISKLLPVKSRQNLELALIGNEGMLGIPLILGVDSSMYQAVVQGSGSALRLSAGSLRRELDRAPALRKLLHQYIYVVHMQLALTAACSNFHSVDLRLAHWLLMTHDRAGFGNFHLTHKFLAQMLGVRRVGITNAAGALQRRKLVRYTRGNITVLNRAALERASCSCYQASKDAYENVLG